MTRYALISSPRLADAPALAASSSLMPTLVGLAGSGIVDRHVALVDGHGLVDDAAGGALHRVRLDVLLHDVDAVDDDALVVHTLRHGAALALVAAGGHDDLVALANLVHGGS
jgi:hypothetical protein